MGTVNPESEVILLFESYTKESEKLHNSFVMTGKNYPAFVIDGDGFEPEGVFGIYDYFLGYSDEAAQPLYFNEIPVPDYWEISGNGSSGKVTDMGREAAKIFYSSAPNKRQVRIVEWYDRKKVVRCSDHFNKYGRLFARTTFNSKGEKYNKSYFDKDGREIIVENFVTKDIIVSLEEKTFLFKNKTELTVFALTRMGLDKCRIFYNSLSFPFFVSQRMPDNGKRDILFWQENTRSDIPGNMMGILAGTSNRTERIVVQKRASYNKLIELGADKAKLVQLGNIYKYEKDNSGNNEALICTNSDQIAHIEDIVKNLPDMHFNICAFTEMSSKLMSLEKYSNVSLLPNIKRKNLEELFEQCSIYLDINMYNEIADAVYNAFINNQLIYAFKNTVHNEQYVADINLYDDKNWEYMVKTLNAVNENLEYREEILTEQREKALSDTVEHYLEILGL